MLDFKGALFRTSASSLVKRNSLRITSKLRIALKKQFRNAAKRKIGDPLATLRSFGKKSHNAEKTVKPDILGCAVTTNASKTLVVKSTLWKHLRLLSSKVGIEKFCQGILLARKMRGRNTHVHVRSLH